MIYYFNVFLNRNTGVQFVAKTKHGSRRTADDRARLVSDLDRTYDRLYVLRVQERRQKWDSLPVDPCTEIADKWHSRNGHHYLKSKKQKKFRRS